MINPEMSKNDLTTTACLSWDLYRSLKKALGLSHARKHDCMSISPDVTSLSSVGQNLIQASVHIRRGEAWASQPAIALIMRWWAEV